MEVFKQKKSKFWWYDFAVRGKRFRRSTGETNKNRAEKIASLKFAEICEHGDPLPRKAPTVLEVSKRFLDSVDAARLAEKSKAVLPRWMASSVSYARHRTASGLGDERGCRNSPV